MIQVKYDIPSKIQATLADGTAVEVAWSAPGGFTAQWGRQRFTSNKLADVVRKIDQHRQGDRESAARARAVRATKPRPALMYPSLEEVGVRGMHAQSGYALITLGNGASGTPVPFSQLLRPLDDAEVAQVREHQEALEKARAALAERRSLKPWDAGEFLDVEVVVSYDTDRGLFTAAVDGEEVAADSASAAIAQAEDRLYRKRWPFTLVNDDDGVRVVPAAEYAEEQYGRDGMFATREEADEYIERLYAVLASQARLQGLLHEYRFDPDAFRSETAS